MKLFVLFAPRFLAWPLTVIERMRADVPDIAITGLVTGGTEVYRVVSDHPVAAAGRIDNLAALEARWVSAEVTEATRKKVLTVFSHEDLKRLIISDRSVGWRYVAGGTAPMAPLMAACEEDRNIEKYIFNLCAWAIDLWESERFDAAFCYAIAGAQALAIAILCARKNISILRLVSSRIGSGYLVDTSPEGLFIPVRTKFEYYLANLDEDDENTAFAKTFLAKFSRAPEQPSYAVNNRTKSLESFSEFRLLRTALADLYCLLRPSETEYMRKAYGYKRLAYNLTTGWRGRRLARSWPYDRAQDIESHRFIFYPLHVDPEASTMVLAPMFTNQLMVLEALSKALPIDMKLVVKEHMPMLGKRPLGFYEAIRRLPNVLLLSPHEDNFDLISKSSLVCVITGTAAWEALLLGKPALVVGSVPFACIAEGFVQCSDLARLPERLSEAFSTSPASHERLVAYVAAVRSESIDFDLWNTSPADLDKAELQVILEKISRKIASICAPAAQKRVADRSAAR